MGRPPSLQWRRPGRSVPRSRLPLKTTPPAQLPRSPPPPQPLPPPPPMSPPRCPSLAPCWPLPAARCPPTRLTRSAAPPHRGLKGDPYELIEGSDADADERRWAASSLPRPAPADTCAFASWEDDAALRSLARATRTARRTWHTRSSMRAPWPLLRYGGRVRRLGCLAAAA